MAAKAKAALTLVGDTPAASEPEEGEIGEKRLNEGPTTATDNAGGSPSSDTETLREAVTSPLAGLTGEAHSCALLALILDGLSEDKAEDVVTINLADKSEIADAMVIASGRSQRHVGAVADKITKRLKQAGVKDVRCEGLPACDWVLIDAGDAIVHLFRPEVRSFYNLERIWSETAHAPTTKTAASDAAQ
ncbi:MAG: ribosome silencing factor [Pseudomonadota bacterium]